MSAVPADAEETQGWPAGVEKVEYPCTADSSLQPAMVYAPKAEKLKPLLVGLHTWSGDYTQTSGKHYANWCIAKGWAFIHPHFRGPNWTPDAMGSELAVQDILDAVEYVKKTTPIDPDRIYLIGASGGGYGALLMAGRAPRVWAGVSAWCPISDLNKWHAECKLARRGYFKHIEKAAQGVPDGENDAARECRKRSALTYLSAANGLALDIATGIHDGHSGSVPVSHTLEAFNEVAAAADKLSAEEIKAFVEQEAVPAHLQRDVADPLYGRKTPLFRRTSANVRVTIFEGGHEIIQPAALHWLEQQRKGKPAVWKTPDSPGATISDAASKVEK